jgi:thioredoxin reductase
MIYDIAIVGYGPAGITAAIYAARKQLRVLLIGEVPGGEVVTSGDIENWPGGGETDGLKLSEVFVKHLDLHTDMVTRLEKKVTLVQQHGEHFSLHVDRGEVATAATVIYAAGRHPRLLGVPGEKEYKNKGVSYCATCDAPLF